MKPARALRIAAACALFCCCTSTEPRIAPLGFGPLAKAELAERERPIHSAPSRGSRSERRAQHAKSPPPPVTSSARAPSTGGASGASDLPSKALDASDSAVLAETNVTEWIGSWKGKDTTRFQIPTFPSEPMTDDNARIRVDSTGTHEIKLVLIDSSNDQDLCSLSAKLVPPNLAQIAAGQPCFGSEDDSFDLSVRVRSGTAKLQGSTLTLDIVLDAEVTSDQLRGNGSVEYHFEGTH